MYFERLGINIQDKEEVIKNYIKVQNHLIKKFGKISQNTQLSF